MKLDFVPRQVFCSQIYVLGSLCHEKIEKNLYNCKQTYVSVVNVLLFKNPSKPHFNHFLFESICIVISTACKLNPSAISTFEDGLFPPFQTILQQDVQGLCVLVFFCVSTEQLFILLFAVHYAFNDLKLIAENQNAMQHVNMPL